MSGSTTDSDYGLVSLFRDDTLCPLEKMPQGFFTHIAKQISFTDRKNLRLSSSTIYCHLLDVFKGYFERLKSRVVVSDLVGLFHFSHSPLAESVKILSLEILDSNTIERDLMANRSLPSSFEKYDLQKRENLDDFQYYLALGHCCGMIAALLARFENVHIVAFTFRDAPILFDSLDPLPAPDPSTFLPSFVATLQVLINRKMWVFIQDPAKSWAFEWTGTEAGHMMSYQPMLPTMQLPNFQDEAFFYPGMQWFCESQSRYLKFLYLRRVGVSLQGIETLFEEAGTLETLELDECKFFYNAPTYSSAFSKPGSKLRKSLRKLSIYFCSGDQEATRHLPKFLKYLAADDCQLEKLRFEQVEGLWFAWDKFGGYFDDGSRLPEIIAQHGVKGAVARMLDCCYWRTMPRHPRLRQLFPR